MSKYSKYLPMKAESRWASEEEIKEASTYIDLSKKNYMGSGLPLLSNGSEAWVDNEDNHSLIFGSTGSKKTRVYVMPLLNIIARAGESFVATDPKGELYEKTASMFKEEGYELIVLNFRDMDGDGWNPLSLPYDFYNSGDKDRAIEAINDFTYTLAKPQLNSRADPFWAETACSLAIANFLLLMDAVPKEMANLASFCQLCLEENISILEDLVKLIDPKSIAGTNYRGVFSEPEKTKMSTTSTLFSMVRSFMNNQRLMNMMSHSSFDIASFGKVKTACYLIIPDEKSTYNFLVTTFVKQCYEILIKEAQALPNNRLPVRVNFVLDEFANLPEIPDFTSCISAARSRNIRYFLVIQSMHQLLNKYGQDAETIKGNCNNWVFLNSKELSLLEEISQLCGNVRTIGGEERSLISPTELQHLRKRRDKCECLVLIARQYPLFTEMPDIDRYPFFKKPSLEKLPHYQHPEVCMLSVKNLYRAVNNCKLPIPFSKKGDKQCFYTGNLK